jgi:stage II sporulation SpoE-like protein
MSAAPLLDSVASPDPPGDRTLVRLTEHVRALLPAGAVLVLRGERFAAWFADPLTGSSLHTAGAHALDLPNVEPLLLPRLDEWASAPSLLANAVAPLGPDSARRLWHRYRSASVIACPLDEGLLVWLAADPARRFGEADLRLARAAADLAGLALEQAEPHDLDLAVEAVSGSLELADVYRSVVEHAAATTGAAQAVLTRLDSRAGELRTVASYDPAAPALGEAALRQVARTRSPVVEPEAVHVPIELGSRLYGVLSVSGASIGPAVVDPLVRLARTSAGAIANAIDFQRERHIARSLTLGFVPEPLPLLDEYETGVLYAPALGEPTGGDLYGMWQLPSGAVATLVGDVAGKGVETAALSAMVRFFVEARSWDAESPAQALEQTNAMLCGRLPSDTFVTAFLAVLTPRCLRWASAGHLPALHLAGDAVHELEATGLPLGVDESARYEERGLALGEGELVFAYTDGLVEARREGEAFGPNRFASLVSRLAGSVDPEELTRRVHDEVAGWAGGLSDDAVAVAVRRRPGAAAPRKRGRFARRPAARSA